MNKHMIIELSNGIEYAVIDILNYNNKKYLLSTKISENKINDNLEILIYDEKNNSLFSIDNEEEYNLINNIFDERLDKKKMELDILSNIDLNNLIKFKVIDIEGYNYKLEFNNKIFIKNIEFYSKSKPDINDIIYISKNIMNEETLSYGHIKNINELDENEILIILKNDKKIYLERYYG